MAREWYKTGSSGSLFITLNYLHHLQVCCRGRFGGASVARGWCMAGPPDSLISTADGAQMHALPAGGSLGWGRATRGWCMAGPWCCSLPHRSDFAVEVATQLRVGPWGRRLGARGVRI